MERFLIGVGGLALAGMLVFAFFSGPGDEGVGERRKIPPMPSDPPPGDDWFRQQVHENPGLVLVDFQADWCGPCRQLNPVLKKLEKEYEGRVSLIEVNVDQHPEASQHYKVESIPLVLLMHRGEVLDGDIGFGGEQASYKTLKRMIERHLSSIGDQIEAPVLETASPEESAPGEHPEGSSATTGLEYGDLAA